MSAEKITQRLKRERDTYMVTVEQILTMYKRKKKISEIAESLGISEKDVLEIISEELDR